MKQKDVKEASQSNHAGESGIRASTPSLGQTATYCPCVPYSIRGVTRDRAHFHRQQARCWRKCVRKKTCHLGLRGGQHRRERLRPTATTWRQSLLKQVFIESGLLVKDCQGEPGEVTLQDSFVWIPRLGLDETAFFIPPVK